MLNNKETKRISIKKQKRRLDNQNGMKRRQQPTIQRQNRKEKVIKVLSLYPEGEKVEAKTLNN